MLQKTYHALTFNGVTQCDFKGFGFEPRTLTGLSSLANLHRPIFTGQSSQD